MNEFDEKQTQFNDRKITKLTMLWYQQMDDKHKENTAMTKTNKPWYHREQRAPAPYLIAVGRHGIVSTLGHGIGHGIATTQRTTATTQTTSHGGGERVTGIVSGCRHIVIRRGRLAVRHVVTAAASAGTATANTTTATAARLVGCGFLLVKVRWGTAATATATSAA